MANHKGTRAAMYYLDTTATPNEYKPWTGAITGSLTDAELRASPVPVVSAFNFINALDVTGWTLSSLNYSGTTSIATDYRLSRIEFNFSSVLSKNITVTTSDGTQLWFSDSDQAENITIDCGSIGFAANENITIAVDRNASSPVCLMNLILVVET